MGVADRHGEADYDMTRAGEWADRSSRSTGVSRRRVLQMLAAVPPLLATTGWRPAAAQTAPAPTILKPLPPEWFTVLGTNAEMRWDALQGQGFTVPNERFFVRNHTSTPTIDARTWRLRVFGSGLRRNQGIELTYRDLRRMRSRTITEVVECAGNGRRFFGDQQATPASGTQWHLGAVGVARWRGVPLGRRTVFHGRSWSGAAPIRRVDVSLDDGATWRPAHLRRDDHGRTWTRWTLPWTPGSSDAGPHRLIARATDRTGATQPATVPFDDGGYQFWAAVRHPVTVA